MLVKKSQESLISQSCVCNSASTGNTIDDIKKKMLRNVKGLRMKWGSCFWKYDK